MADVVNAVHAYLLITPVTLHPNFFWKVPVNNRNRAKNRIQIQFYIYLINAKITCRCHLTLAI